MLSLLYTIIFSVAIININGKISRINNVIQTQNINICLFLFCLLIFFSVFSINSFVMEPNITQSTAHTSLLQILPISLLSPLSHPHPASKSNSFFLYQN